MLRCRTEGENEVLVSRWVVAKGMTKGKVRLGWCEWLLTFESKYSLFAVLATGEASVADRMKQKTSIERRGTILASIQYIGRGSFKQAPGKGSCTNHQLLRCCRANVAML